MKTVKRITVARRLAARAASRCCGLAVISSIAVTALAASVAYAEAGDATSSQAARNEAVRAIPWRQLSPTGRRAAQTVINNTSIYRRLPTRIIDCDPEMFSFLLQHPEVVIDVWRVMGVSQLALEKLPGGAYRAADNAGTSGTVRFLHADWGPEAKVLAVVLADGAYVGPPFGAPLKAQSIILLRSGSVQETNGRYYITVRIDSFIRLEQIGVELVAKTVQPWIAKTADQNFIETLSFVSNFSRTAEQNPAGIERLAARLPSLDGPTRTQLVAQSFRTAGRYSQAAIGEGNNPALLAQQGELSP
jgi:hypothetical protein